MVTGEMFHEHCENESVDPTPCPVARHQQLNFQSITICLFQKHPSQIQTTVKEEKWMIIGHVQSESAKRMKSISRIVQVLRPFATVTLLKKVYFAINISDKKSRRFDLSEVIFKCIKVL